MKTFRCKNVTLVGIDPTTTTNKTTGDIAQKEGGFSMKKVISVLLALVCALSLVLVPAYADGELDAEETMTITVNGNLVTGPSDFLMGFLAQLEGNAGAELVAEAAPVTLPVWTLGGSWALLDMFQSTDEDPYFRDLEDLGLRTNERGYQHTLADVSAGDVLKISGSYVDVYVNGEFKFSTLPGGDPDRNTLLFVSIPVDCQLELVFTKGWIPSVQVFRGRPYVWAEYRDLAIIQLTNVIPHLVDRPYSAVDCRFGTLDGAMTDVIYTMENDTLVTNGVVIPDVG
ncbi:MAG: hypothetical protein Q4G02_03235 [bacterium]|nr:hypothetical protein [bacterium]